MLEHTRISGSQAGFYQYLRFARPFDRVLLIYGPVLLSYGPWLLSYGPVLLSYGP